MLRQAKPEGWAPSETLTYREAMWYLGVSDKTLTSLLRRGLPFVQLGVGRSYRFRKQQLDDFLDGRIALRKVRRASVA